MRISVALIALFLLFPLMFLPSCSNKNGEKTVTIYGNVVIDPKSIAEGHNFLGSGIEDLIFSRLVTEEEMDRYKNLLITLAKPIGDGSVWEMEIREGVRFHNGAPLTVQDVIISIEKRRELAEGLSAIKKATAVDGKRIRLTLDRPYRDISKLLIHVYVYPGGMFSMVEEWRETILKNQVGSGPFKFSRWIKNGVELKANAEYFEGRPKIDRLIYTYENDEKKLINNLLNGDAEILSTISPKGARFLEKDPKYSVNKLASEYFVAVFLNTESPFFRESEVRRAVNMAVDRETIIDKALNEGGKAAYGPFVKNMLPDGYSPETVRYDPKEAVKILNRAGWRDKDGDGVLERNGVRFKMVLYYTLLDTDALRLAADLISGQLYEAGIEVESRAISFTDFMESRFPDRYDAIIKELAPFSPDLLWSKRFYKDRSGLNLSNYRNMKAEPILAGLRNTDTPEDIMEKRAGLDRLIREDCPAIFLYNCIDYSVVSKKVNPTDFVNTPYDYYMLREIDKLD